MEGRTGACQGQREKPSGELFGCCNGGLGSCGLRRMSSQAPDGLLGYMKAAFKAERGGGSLCFYRYWRRGDNS